MRACDRTWNPIIPRAERRKKIKGRNGHVRRPRRKAEDTRAEILDMAERVFTERGIAGSSIAHVAQALGMSPANVFKHFHSKVALADAICQRSIENMAAQLQALNVEEPAPDRLRSVAHQLMAMHLAAFKTAPYMIEMLLILSETEMASGARYGEMIEGLFAGLIRHGIESNIYYCRDIPARSRAVAAAFVTILHPVFLVRTPMEELEMRCDEIVELVNIALQNPLAK